MVGHNHCRWVERYRRPRPSLPPAPAPGEIMTTRIITVVPTRDDADPRTQQVASQRRLSRSFGTAEG